MPNLTWIGKDKVIKHCSEIPFCVLDKKYYFDANGENTLSLSLSLSDENSGEINSQIPQSDNKIIHGDNLLALKSLMPEFGGKIKCIYIDPPYNTGNENWAYNDNVNDSKIKKWLNKVVGSDDLSRHDKWLCMMYPRLRLLHELLSKDGVIFISIDDNEIANLKLLCDEIFGERKFLGCISWLKGNAQNDADNFQKNHEYILCYTKNSANIISQIEQKVKVKVFYDEKNKKYFREGAGLTTGGAGGTLNARPNLGFSIYYNPKTKDFLGVDDYDKELAKISNDEAEVYSDDINLKNQGYVIIRPPKKGVGLGRWTWELDLGVG